MTNIGLVHFTETRAKWIKIVWEPKNYIQPVFDIDPNNPKVYELLVSDRPFKKNVPLSFVVACLSNSWQKEDYD